MNATHYKKPTGRSRLHCLPDPPQPPSFIRNSSRGGCGAMRACALLSVWASVGILTWGQLDNTKTIDAGFVVQGEREVSLYSQSLSGTVVVKLVPNLPSDLKDCHKAILQSYNKTLTDILTPLGESIKYIRGNASYTLGRGQARIVGAILGGVALGVATSAQITAAMALVQTEQNAKNILKLKKSIAETNNAVQEIINGQQQLGIAIGKIQDYVNNVLNDTTQKIDCVTSANRLGVELSLYLTQITTAFGNQIRNPALSDLSIQALYNLAGGNLDSFIRKIGGDVSNLQSVLASGLIKGQPIGYDSETQLLLITVRIPSISKIKNMRMASLVPISVTTPKGPGMVIIPRYVVKLASAIEEIFIDDCFTTETDLYCSRLVTSPLSSAMQNCIGGVVQDCMYTTANAVLSTPFASIQGSIVANCEQVTCRCRDPPAIISQTYGKPLTIITQHQCSVIEIDGIAVKLKGDFQSQYGGNLSIVRDQVAITGPLDVNAELSKVNASISSAQTALDRSNAILNGVNVSLIRKDSMVGIIIGLVIAIILALLSCGLAVYSCLRGVKQEKYIKYLLSKPNTKM
uniref:Fusion glycoprotein F0 n=1 Tax=Avulavirus sp. TaxID=2493083 RepID=A0A481XX74_9MONO|nr:F [Avulavirus sp.] [Avulavirus sp.]